MGELLNTVSLIFENGDPTLDQTLVCFQIIALISVSLSVILRHK
ncbi:MAG: hypothetical protein ACSW8A_07495 [Lachnospiraceae bacterium]